MKKMYLKNKAQSAMEYLMTYSWAILVVMIVGIVMWQLGIFNIGTGTQTFKGFGAIKPQLAGTGLTKEGNFTGVFFNGVGTRINITSVNASVEGEYCTDIDAKIDGYDIPRVMDKATNFKLSGIDGCATGELGSPYDIDITIEYTVTIGKAESVARKSSGTIHGPYE